MNWKKINKNCPNTFKLLLNYFHVNQKIKKRHINEILSYSTKDYLGTIYFRELYKFFDDHSLDVFVTDKWEGIITTDDLNSELWEEIKLKGECQTRKKLEYKLFTKAFKVMESNICREKNNEFFKDIE